MGLLSKFQFWSDWKIPKRNNNVVPNGFNARFNFAAKAADISAIGTGIANSTYSLSPLLDTKNLLNTNNKFCKSSLGIDGLLIIPVVAIAEQLAKPGSIPVDTGEAQNLDEFIDLCERSTINVSENEKAESKCITKAKITAKATDKEERAAAKLVEKEPKDLAKAAEATEQAKCIATTEKQIVLTTEGQIATPNIMVEKAPSEAARKVATTQIEGESTVKKSSKATKKIKAEIKHQKKQEKLDKKKAKSDAKRKEREKNRVQKLEKEYAERPATLEELQMVHNANDSEDEAKRKQKHAEWVAKNAVYKIREADRATMLARQSRKEAEAQYIIEAEKALDAEDSYNWALERKQEYKRRRDDYQVLVAEKRAHDIVLQKEADMSHSDAMEELLKELTEVKAQIAAKTLRANEAMEGEKMALTQVSTLEAVLKKKDESLAQRKANRTRVKQSHQKVLEDNLRQYRIRHAISDCTSDKSIEN